MHILCSSRAKKELSKAIDRKEIFKAIEQERERQEKLHPQRKLKKSHDKELILMQTYIQQNELLAVLVEEVGEVGKALQEGTNLSEELIQVASVCVRWLELKDPAE